MPEKLAEAQTLAEAYMPVMDGLHPKLVEEELEGLGLHELQHRVLSKLQNRLGCIISLHHSSIFNVT